MLFAAVVHHPHPLVGWIVYAGVCFCVIALAYYGWKYLSEKKD